MNNRHEIPSVMSVAGLAVRSESYLTAIVLALLTSYTALSIAEKPVPDVLESALILIIGGLVGIPLGVKTERERTLTKRNGNGGE